jgi:leader peptidase (prepilin peptidase)/N-methyltransferase
MPIYLYPFVALFGWAAGALVNYLADSLPWARHLVTPFCSSCKAPISWQNYLIWPRRCLACGKKRAWRVWLVEVIYITATIWVWLFPPARLGFIGGLVLLVYFGIVVIIDMEHRLILHLVSIIGAILGLVLGILWRVQLFVDKLPSGSVLGSFDPWRYGIWTTLLGGIAGFGSMWLLYLLGEGILRILAHLRGNPVDETALGFGDVSLSGVLGLILGWPAVGIGLFLAVLAGGIISLIYMLFMMLTRRYHMFMALPYGPFLVTGAVIVIYFREPLASVLR